MTSKTVWSKTHSYGKTSWTIQGGQDTIYKDKGKFNNNCNIKDKFREGKLRLKDSIKEKWKDEKLSLKGKELSMRIFKDRGNCKGDSMQPGKEPSLVNLVGKNS